jgi:hypothetical protein
VAYAGGVSLLAGQGLTDPWIYIAAILGGEILDVIDHPLYHLLYQRNEPHVVEARRLFFKKGIRATISYLNEVENKRMFKGLLLHNVFALTLAMFLGIAFSLFLPASIYWFVFFGALLLHMLTDIFADFLILGHADNWLWVIRDLWLERWGQQGNRLVKGIFFWVVFVPLGFLIVTIRWGWQSAHPSAFTGLYGDISRTGYIWLPYAALAGMIYYLAWLVVVCAAAAHKYGLELGTDGRLKQVPFSVGSLRRLKRFLSRKKPGNDLSLERTYLYIQADQAVWVIILAALIVIVLLGLTWLQWDNDMIFFLSPIFLALLFGTFIHTTVGEFGGVFGVLSAWLLNVTLGHLGLQPLWPLSRGYLLFGAALVAWALGLFGAIFLKGLIRMSVVVFTIDINPKSRSTTDDLWMRDVLDLVTKGLQQGYVQSHQTLYGRDERSFIQSTPINLMLESYVKRPVLGADYYHLQASDSYAPIQREMAYVLCGNRLTEAMKKSRIMGEHGPLPVMPRYRIIEIDGRDADMSLLDGTYRWHSKRRVLSLYPPVSSNSVTSYSPKQLLVKTWAEFLDNLVTRQSTFQSDLFIYPSLRPDTVTICGLVRERTSTKEYATVEAETYAGAVMKEIIRGAENDPLVNLGRYTSGRIIFPQVSIFDQDLVQCSWNKAVLPSDSSALTAHEFATVRKSLDMLPSTNLLPHATADFSKKLGVLIFETAVTTLIAAIGFNNDWVVHFVSNLLGQP